MKTASSLYQFYDLSIIMFRKVNISEVFTSEAEFKKIVLESNKTLRFLCLDFAQAKVILQTK